MSDQPASEPQSPQTNQFSVPEAYKDAAWAQNIKSPDDLWGQFANAQTLIGKRPAGIPTADAPDTEWDKFHSLMRPESPDKYALSEIEGIPEGVDISSYKQSALQMFHEAGLNAKQADKLWKAYIGSELEASKGLEAKSAEQKAALDKEFDALTAKLWGDKYKDVEAKSLEIIKTAIPDELKDAIPYIAENPKALAATMKLIEHSEAQATALRSELAEVKRKYGVEDKLSSGAQTAGTSKDDVLKQLTEANMKVRGLDPFSPERKELMTKIEEMRGQLQRIIK
jgi:hypothetical protein